MPFFSKHRGQQTVITLVYLIIGSIVFVALTPGLSTAIQTTIPFVDNLTALILRWFVGLAFIVMLWGIWESTKPFHQQAINQ